MAPLKPQLPEGGDDGIYLYPWLRGHGSIEALANQDEFALEWPGIHG